MRRVFRLEGTVYSANKKELKSAMEGDLWWVGDFDKEEFVWKGAGVQLQAIYYREGGRNKHVDLVITYEKEGVFVEWFLNWASEKGEEVEDLSVKEKLKEIDEKYYGTFGKKTMWENEGAPKSILDYIDKEAEEEKNKVVEENSEEEEEEEEDVFI